MRLLRPRPALLCAATAITLLILFWASCRTSNRQQQQQQWQVQARLQKHSYDRLHPVIFVGGMPSSGTTLIRAVLDAHPYVRCGVETRVIPRLLHLYENWRGKPRERNRLQAAGILGEPLDAAVTAFVLEVIARNGEPAPRLCSKDPYTLAHMPLLSTLFPKSRFVLVLRDGRAVLASLLHRNVTITGFNLRKPLECLRNWNQQVQLMHGMCETLGLQRCLPLRYEDFVLQPRLWSRRLAEFVQVPFHPNMLSHWKLVGGAHVSVSRTEKSSAQIARPIHVDSLYRWTKQLTRQVLLSAPKHAPMLAQLGYDVIRMPPYYGEPDPWVFNQTQV